MENFMFEQENINSSEKITLAQVWNNQQPVMHWCFAVTSISFGFVYMLTATMF